ncbi:MAG: VOC family protein [Fimbriimonas sp.]|nr:VOC family protein [Fimbriimonas sp.]
MGSVFANLILDVGDIDRSLAFYHDLLHLPIGRQEVFAGHRLAYLVAGQTEILLLQQPKDEQNPTLHRSGGLVMKFYVSGLRDVASFLHQMRVTVLQDLEMPSIGERTLLVADPDGYAVLLAEPVETLH